MRFRGVSRLAANLGWDAGLGLTTLLGGCHLEQVQFGQVVRIVTPPAGACAPVGLVFVVDAQRRFEGTVQRGGQTLGDLGGALAQDDSFGMTVTPPSGAVTRISGTIGPVTTTFSIAGDALGTGCNGQVIQFGTGRLFQGPFTSGGNG
jgi:hypothetical protein